jgi:hypothetical protein
MVQEKGDDHITGNDLAIFLSPLGVALENMQCK